MRLWNNLPDTVEVRWFRAAKGAKPLGLRTRFTSRVWLTHTDKGLSFPIGEQVGPRPYDNGANPQGYLGVNRCGDDSVWFFGGTAGVTPDITTGPDGTAACCRMPDQVGRGGGAGGGRGRQTVAQVGRGGGAGGGSSWGWVLRSRGGGAGGGRGFQGGDPYAQLGRGGGAGGGRGFQGGDPYAQLGRGGGAGGGAAEQGPEGIVTDCCGSTPIPLTTHWTFSGSSDPDGNMSVEVAWNPTNEQWESGPFSMGSQDDFELFVRCTSGFWQMQLQVEGGPFLLLITFDVDCGPPHNIVWEFVVGSWPGLTGSGPDTGTWAP